MRLFDTAPLYGHGLAELRLGRALRGRPRDDFVLATKVGRLLRADAPPDPGQSFWPGARPVNPVFDFSFDGTLRSVEESLERLGLDRIDILHLHDPDEHVDEALAGAYPALDRLRAEGMIRAVGAGSNAVEPLLRLAREAHFDCFLVAGRCTLLDRSALAELLPLCVEREIRVIAGGVFNSGVLAGGATFEYRLASPALLERAASLKAVCDRQGVPLPAAAIQFPFRHGAVASVLVGARSPAEIDEDVDLATIPIPDELWAELA